MSEISYPYQLPSRGRLYGDQVPDGKVSFRLLRGPQEEILAGAKPDDNENQLLRYVTEGLIDLPKDFAFQELLVSDWVALVIQIMSRSYRDSITISPKCRHCTKSFPLELSVDQMECITADTFDGEYQEPFETCLPLEKDKVLFRLLRIRDLQRIEEYAEQLKTKSMRSNPLPTYTMTQQIISINEEGASGAVRIRATNWLGGDRQEFRRAVAKVETGYNLNPEIECRLCGRHFHVRVPLDFFRYGAES